MNVLLSSGMEIRDISVYEKNGGRWFSLPSKPYKNKEGEDKWSPYIGFPEKKDYERFMDALGEAFKEHTMPEQVEEDLPF